MNYFNFFFIKYYFLSTINYVLSNFLINNYFFSLLFNNVLKKKNSYLQKIKKQKILSQSKKKNIINFQWLMNNFFFFIFYNKTKFFFFYFYNLYLLNINFKKFSIFNRLYSFYKSTFGEGYIYVRGLFLIFFLDSLITDDEPLWEPVEWSLIQTWIFFIFCFAWIAENLITSRYGSYTGRDKRVWFAWYKTFWLIELWYALSFGAAAMFVIVPFYYELTYTVSFVFSWWNWYNRVFFFKFISIYTILILISHVFQLNIRWLNWKKNFFFMSLITVFISYLLYTQFIITFFSYFTDPLWYQKTRFIDYVQLSHEPLKWGWGPAKRDHFTYHKVSTVFWFKNDAPFAGAFLMFNLFFFLSIFFLLFYWLVLIRKTYALREVSYTFSTYCISSLKQFYYFFFLFYILIFISFIVCYWRFPVEFIWIINSHSWFITFFYIFKDYLFFLINIFF